MNLIQKKTCIKFQQRKNDEVHILINKAAGQGCYAIIGYRPQYSPIPVNLQSPECLAHSGTIQHELLHVIGLMHEQSRTDRDQFVEIVWDNIEESKLKNIYLTSNTITKLQHNLASSRDNQ